VREGIYFRWKIVSDKFWVHVCLYELVDGTYARTSVKMILCRYWYVLGEIKCMYEFVLN